MVVVTAAVAYLTNNQIHQQQPTNSKKVVLLTATMTKHATMQIVVVVAAAVLVLLVAIKCLRQLTKVKGQLVLYHDGQLFKPTIDYITNQPVIVSYTEQIFEKPKKSLTDPSFITPHLMEVHG